MLDSKRTLIQENLGHSIFITPCGVTSDEMTDIARQNYNAIRLIGHNLNVLPIRNSYNLEALETGVHVSTKELRWWISEAKRKKMWAILMIHQVSDEEHEYGVTPGEFKEILDIVKNSGLDVVLPSQVLSIKE